MPSTRPLNLVEWSRGETVGLEGYTVSRRLLPAILLLVCQPFTAHAVDGVLEINLTCALNTGCFTGDSPGFPVTIGQRGSYRLTGNLQVENSDQTAIDVTPTLSLVTIDLNGFTILGSTICQGAPPQCSGTGSGVGVAAAVPDGRVVVRNGHIRGMGDAAVRIGSDGLVEDLLITSNGGNGIDCSLCVVRGNRVSFNGGSGIVVSTSSIVKENTMFRNVGFGMEAGASSGYVHNTMKFNTLGQVTGGVQVGPNVCDNSLCP
jgi:parallel beta-helix repeat protein